MLKTRSVLILTLISCLITPQVRSQVADADTEFAAGMSARDQGQVDAALQHLQSTVALDPKMTRAHLAIGAIAELWCNSSEGFQRCKLALAEFKRVLELDASRTDALKNIAYASYMVDEIDQAETYYRKALDLNADDPEALGGVAAIDQRRSYGEEGMARMDHNIPLGKPLIDSPACQEVRQRNLARVEEGITLLTRALRIRNNDSDLMGYLSQLLRDRAEITCASRQAYKADMSRARKWNHMLHETLNNRKASDDFLRRLPPGTRRAPISILMPDH